MNTADLNPLSNRWPNDDVIAGTESTLDILNRTLQAAEARESPYRARLVIDPRDQASIEAFAADNGLRYTQSVPNLPKSTHQPAWFGERLTATMPMNVHAINGSIQGFAAMMFLQYTPSTSGRRVFKPGEIMTRLHRRSVIRVQLPKTFPQLVLDSNRNDGAVFGTLATSIDRKQITPLEGDFNKIFDFYSPAGLAIDTRVVLAPNFMQLAMDGASMFDIEFYGNEIIFVTTQNIYTPETMETAMRLINEQLAYLVRLLPSWNYAPQTAPFNTLRYNVFRGMYNGKVGPLRFGPKTLIAGVAVVIILMAIALIITK